MTCLVQQRVLILVKTLDAIGQLTHVLEHWKVIMLNGIADSLTHLSGVLIELE